MRPRRGAQARAIRLRREAAGRTEVASIVLSPGSITGLGIDAEQQVVASLFDSEGNELAASNYSLVWQSSNTAVATVLASSGSDRAIVSGEGAGNCTISCSVGAISANCAVTVTAAVTYGVYIETQPTRNPQSGVVWPEQPVVRLRRTDNLEPLELAGVSVTLEVPSYESPTDLILSGDTTIETDSLGVATFSGISSTGVVGATTDLRFYSIGYSDAYTNVTLQEAPSTEPPPGGGDPDFPNEPEGYVTILEMPFESATIPADPTTGEATSPSAGWSLVTGQSGVPISGDRFWRATYGPGLSAGSSPGSFLAGITTAFGSNPHYNSWYTSIRLRVHSMPHTNPAEAPPGTPTSGFFNQLVGCKLFYWCYGSTSEGYNQGFPEMHNGNGMALTMSSMQLQVQMSSTLDSGGTGTSDPGSRSHYTSGRVEADGEWEHWEFLHYQGTDGEGEYNQGNGYIKVWRDDVLVGQWNSWKGIDVAGFTRGLFGINFAPVWGGSGGASHNATDYIDFDHFKVSGKNI